VLTVERREAETVNSGSVEPDQVKTCEGNKGNLRVTAPEEEQASSAHRRDHPWWVRAHRRESVPSGCPARGAPCPQRAESGKRQHSRAEIHPARTPSRDKHPAASSSSPRTPDKQTPI